MKKIIKLTLALLLAVLALSIFSSCEKEELNTSREDCEKRNSAIVQSVIDEQTQWANFQINTGYYWHIKTRDSIVAIYNEMMSRTFVEESPQSSIATMPLYLKEKFDAIDSMNRLWKEKELAYRKEAQARVEEEILKLKRAGVIRDCDQDTPNLDPAKS